MTPATRNGAPQDARSAAASYLARGLAVIPLPARSKDPGFVGWQHPRGTTDTLDVHFPPESIRNIGVLNGLPSSNVHDVDLDCVETLIVAPVLLPPTGWIFGRPSAPASHRIYRTDRSLDAAQEKFTDLDG